jgi:hypothetical protein
MNRTRKQSSLGERLATPPTRRSRIGHVTEGTV